MNKSIRTNYIFNLSYQFITMLTPLITTPYLSRMLGAGGIGDVSFAESIVTYFRVFAALGISTYGTREISYLQNDKRRRSILFWNIKALQLITCSASIALYFLFIFLSEYKQGRLHALFLILSVDLLSVFFDFTWFYQGMEEFR